jgi:hypothetical protein
MKLALGSVKQAVDELRSSGGKSDRSGSSVVDHDHSIQLSPISGVAPTAPSGSAYDRAASAAIVGERVLKVAGAPRVIVRGSRPGLTTAI